MIFDFLLVPGESCEINQLSPLAQSFQFDAGTEGGGAVLCVNPLAFSANGQPGAAYFARNQNHLYTANCLGNFGIGTSDPTGTLHLVGGDDELIVQDRDNARLRLRSEMGRDFAISTDSTGRLFVTDTEAKADRFVIDADGRLGVRTNVPDNDLDLHGNFGMFGQRLLDLVESEGRLSFGDLRGGDGRIHEISIRVNDRENVTILEDAMGIGTTQPTSRLHVSGPVCATAHTICSDRRFKEGIEPIEDALGRVQALRGVEFTWNAEYRTRQGSAVDLTPQVGLIAQEVETIFPDVVSVGTDGYRSVDYGRLTAVLIEAIKDQQGQIDELETRIRGVEEIGVESD